MIRSVTVLAVAAGCGSVFCHENTRPKTPLEKAGLVAAAPDRSVEITVRVTDAGDGTPLSSCLRIREVNPTVTKDAQTPWLDLSPLLARGIGLSQARQRLGWFVLPRGEATIRVPEGELVVEAIHGIEYRKGTATGAGPDFEIRLERLFHPTANRWIPGNTHLHLREMTREESNRYLRDVSAADGLDVVFVSYLERAIVDRTYITNGYSAADLEKLSTGEIVFGSGEEYRHNFGGGGEGYGHVMLLEHARRILPASLGPGITKQGTDGTPLRPGIDRAREDGGTVIWCHNRFGFEDIPSWISGRVDAQNIFDGGNRGSYEDSFYRYLNLGLKVPFSTGTDWFIYDFSRVYVPLETEIELSPKSWLAALEKGRSVITNGPWIELSVNGKGPGETIELDRGEERIHVEASAVAEAGFDSLELIRNGRLLHQEPAAGGRATISLPVRIGEPAWIAARIKPKDGITNHLGEPIFAHTSPVYLNLGGKGVSDEETARVAVAELKACIAEIMARGRFASDEERESVLRIYREAAEALERPPR